MPALRAQRPAICAVGRGLAEARKMLIASGDLRARPENRQGEPKMVAFENRSGAYFRYVSSGSAESRHLQAAMAIFGAGSDGNTLIRRM